MATVRFYSYFNKIWKSEGGGELGVPKKFWFVLKLYQHYWLKNYRMIECSANKNSIRPKATRCVIFTEIDAFG